MIIYDLSYFRGMEHALRAAGVGYGSPGYALAHEVWELQNLAACPIPPARHWDRPALVAEFRAAVARAGTPTQLLRWMLTPVAKKAKTGSEYWVRFEDESSGHCGKCASIIARRARRRGNTEAAVDGGYGAEVDYPSFCGVCGVYLDETILQFEEELRRLVTHGPSDQPVDCAILLNCLYGAEGDEELAPVIRTIALQHFAAYPHLRPAAGDEGGAA